MTLKEAMDALGFSAIDVAAALGTTAQHVRQMRMDPGHPNARPAPSGWQKKLIALARKRNAQTTKVIEQLEREAR